MYLFIGKVVKDHYNIKGFLKGENRDANLQAVASMEARACI